MDKLKAVKDELVKKLQQCINEAGLKAEADVGVHEAVIHARADIEGVTLKVMAFITDREVKPEGCGPVSAEVMKERLLTAVIRPTLAQQAMAAVAPGIPCAVPPTEQHK